MLRVASESQNLSVLKLLSSCPKAHGITDSDVIDSLRCSCENGFVDGFALICDHMVADSTRQQLERHVPALIQACLRCGQPDMARMLLAKLELDTGQKNAFLSAACSASVTNTALLNALLDSVSFSGAVLAAALLALASKKPLNISGCEALMNHGADVNLAVDPVTGRSLAHVLISEHYGLGIDAFLRRGLRLNCADFAGGHCLVPAFSLGLCGLIARLLAYPNVCAVIRPDVLGVDVFGVLLEKRHLQCCAVPAIHRPGVNGARVTLAAFEQWWPNVGHFVRQKKRHLSDCFVFRWRHNLFARPKPCERDAHQALVDRLFLLITAVMDHRRADGETEYGAANAVHTILHILCLADFLHPSQARFLCSEAATDEATRCELQSDSFLAPGAPSLVLLAVREVREALGSEDFALRLTQLPLPPRYRRMLADERVLAW